MAGGDAFARIVAALNEAPFQDDGWLRASALIDEACRTHGSMLGHTTGDSVENSQVHLAILSHRGERQEEIERLYLDNYVRIDERIPHLRNLPDSSVAHISDLLSEEQLKASVVYNEYLVRVHRKDGLDVRLDGPGGSNILWSIRETIDGDGWSSDQLRLIDALLPHIRQYITVQETVANAGGQNASFADMLGLPGIGIIKIDARGRIVAANDRARAELQRRNGLSDVGGTLSAVLPGDNDRLQRLLARALPRLRDPAAAGSTMVHRNSQGPGVIVHVHPVVDPETGYVGRRVAALVMIVDPLGRESVAPSLVMSVLGLTPVEAEIAVMLAEGWTARQIAGKTGRAYSTVRTHLKHVFDKLGVSRQYELARQVSALSILPAPDDPSEAAPK